MAITFDTTIGGTDSNSYTTVAEFNTYTDKLSNIDDIPKNDQTTAIQKLLIAATEAVDAELRSHSIGYTPTTTQRLEWPRSGTYDRRSNPISNDIIPQELKEAVIEQAIWLYQNSVNHASHDGWDDEPVSAEIGGNLSFDYEAGRKPANMIPERVKFLLSYIGTAYVRQTQKRRV